MIPLERALDIALEAASARRLPVRRRPLREAGGLVLAADIASALDIPPFDRATMDGYAIPRPEPGGAGDGASAAGSPGAGGAAGRSGPAGAAGRDEAGAAARVLRLAGVVNAGDPPPPPLAPGTAFKVMTGAAAPPNAERVVPVEQARERDGRVELLADAAAPRFIAPRGEDTRQGEIVARAGERLDPLLQANLLACGVETVTAVRPPRVAIAATGDELVERAADLAPGRIVNTNAPLLRAALEAGGAVVSVHRTIPDDPAATRERIAGLLGQADVTVLTGGVSMGDRDHVPGALRSLGLTVLFDRVALQPGKPTLLAAGERGLVFGLPGNPVSAFVTCHLFVLPALAAMAGRWSRPRFVTLPLAEAWRGRAHDRVRLFPAALTREGGVRLLPYHSSGHLRALLGADGLARLEPEWAAREAGQPLAFWPLRAAAYEEGREGGGTDGE